MRGKFLVAAGTAGLLGVGLGAGVALAASQSTNATGVIVCYANQHLLTGGGSWVSSGEGANVKELFHPDFNQGSGTDGHGLDVFSGGSNQGDC